MRYLVIATMTLVTTAALGQAPSSMSFQGSLTDSLGNPIDSTDVGMTFKMYKNGTAVWTEAQSVDVRNGVFNAMLGKIVPLDTFAFDEPIDLGIKLDGEASEISPRTPLTAVSYAKALPGLYTFYRESSANNYKGYNVVGGAANNVVATWAIGATIGGGGGILNWKPVPNRVLASWATVGGGANNEASWWYTTVGGGVGNTASGWNSTIGGGSGNEASGGAATVGGGASNTANGDRATVAGGSHHTVSGEWATVAGGLENTASGWMATISGGRLNTASAQQATVGGGYSNTASGTQATVSGGHLNFASGTQATVLGGFSNRAVGNNSLAAGTRAAANHSGTFVWQDSAGYIGPVLSSTAPNQFLARASGGFFFLTGATPDLTTGITLPAGSGTWTSLSSKTSKTNFGKIDSQSYLDRVASLELKEWSYNTEKGVTHIGPMAEDFYAAFGHGPTDKGISGVDADGVALAAIQGLFELVQVLQAENEQIRTAIANLDLDLKAGKR